MPSPRSKPVPVDPRWSLDPFKVGHFLAGGRVIVLAHVEYRVPRGARYLLQAGTSGLMVSAFASGPWEVVPARYCTAGELPRPRRTPTPICHYDEIE